jgi:excinuclease ABC subunit C
VLACEYLYTRNMTPKDFKKLNLPDTPGVYFFKKGATVLYIGRATSLRDRVASYFKNDLMETRGPLLVDMVVQASSLKWEEAGSVLEAIILESNLIKKYQPKHNTKEKDDRSYNYVVITDEEFPRVILVRGRVLESAPDVQLEKATVPIRYKFGPYPQGSLLREALAVIRKIFPFRDAKASAIPGKSTSEKFYCSIGLSPEVLGPDAKKEYGKTIRNISLFLEGRKKDLTKALAGDMKAHAKAREFEKAEKVKRTLYAIEHIQDVALIKKNSDSNNGNSGSGDATIRIEAYDVAHLSGGSVVGVMTVVENGEPNKNEYRKFKIHGKGNGPTAKAQVGNDDVGGLREILTRRFNHPEWPMPNLIAVDGGIAQKNAAEKIALSIPVVSIVKDDRHRPRDILASSPVEKKLANEHRAAILLANAEAHRFAIAYHRRTRRRNLLG